MEKEKWKVVDFKWFGITSKPNTTYEVSNYGNIKSIDAKGNETIKSTRPKSNDKSKNKPLLFGAYINGQKENKEVDICVACAFIDDTKSFSKIKFNDGNSENCELSNLSLEYITSLDFNTIQKLVALKKEKDIEMSQVISNIIIDYLK